MSVLQSPKSNNVHNIIIKQYNTIQNKQMSVLQSAKSNTVHNIIIKQFNTNYNINSLSN